MNWNNFKLKWIEMNWYGTSHCLRFYSLSRCNIIVSLVILCYLHFFSFFYSLWFFNYFVIYSKHISQNYFFSIERINKFLLDIIINYVQRTSYFFKFLIHSIQIPSSFIVLILLIDGLILSKYISIWMCSGCTRIKNKTKFNPQEKN